MQPVNMLSPEFTENPYAIFRELREKAPVCKVGPINYWGIFRYGDVLKALSNPGLFSSRAMTDPNAVFPEIRRYMQTEALVAMDPPNHGRMRRNMSAALAMRNVSSLEGRIRTICSELLNQLPDPNHFDLMSSFAMPLPFTVICELLGVEASRRADFKDWTDRIMLTLPVSSMQEGPKKEAAKRHVEEGYRKFEEFLEELIAERTASPQEDLVSAMIAASNEERITTQDVISLSRFLLIAGSEGTTNFIAIGMRVLLRNRELLQALRRDRSLIPAFAEECLRFDGPTMAVLRLLTEDLTLHGVEMKRGDRVALFLASANRDDTHFPSPDKFDIQRDANHLAFWRGNHFCIGAQLARLEFRIALETMLDRYEDFWLGDKGFAQSALILQVFRHFDLHTRSVSA